jgi:hypothetical protein
MSNKWRQEWAQAVRRARGLSMTARMVGQVLALDFANADTGQCNPSHSTLAAHLDVSVDTIKRAVRELARAGWLTKTPGQHRGHSSQFTFLSPGKVVSFADSKPGTGAETRAATGEKGGHRCTPCQPEKGGKSAPEGGQICTPLYKGRNQVRTKGASAWSAHRFSANAFDGPTLIPTEDHEAMTAWGLWLSGQGFPPLLSLPIVQTSAEKRRSFVALPWKRPPDRPDRIEEARAYFIDVIDNESFRHVAQ